MKILMKTLTERKQHMTFSCNLKPVNTSDSVPYMTNSWRRIKNTSQVKRITIGASCNCLGHVLKKLALNAPYGRICIRERTCVKPMCALLTTPVKENRREQCLIKKPCVIETDTCANRGKQRSVKAGKMLRNIGCHCNGDFVPNCGNVLIAINDQRESQVGWRICVGHISKYD